jgi:hypothetical protein
VLGQFLISGKTPDFFAEHAIWKFGLFDIFSEFAIIKKIIRAIDSRQIDKTCRGMNIFANQRSIHAFCLWYKPQFFIAANGAKDAK